MQGICQGKLKLAQPQAFQLDRMAFFEVSDPNFLRETFLPVSILLKSLQTFPDRLEVREVSIESKLAKKQ